MRRSAWIVFAAMCAWQASSWLLPHGDVEGASVLARMGVGCALAAVVVFLASRGKEAGQAVRKTVVGSLCLFAVPAVLVSVASEQLGDTMLTLVFAFAPVVAVMVWSGFSARSQTMTALVPALVATSGLLLIFPFALPVSAKGWSSFALAVFAMVVGVGGAVALRVLGRQGGWRTVAVSGVVNAVVLIGFCALRGSLSLRGWGVLDWSDAAVWGLVFVAGVWLAQRMTPVGFAGRFLVVPLLTILEGAALIRPEVTGRLVAGIGLLAAGSAWLLARPEEAVDEEILSLR